jgi:hypothetical protein
VSGALTVSGYEGYFLTSGDLTVDGVAFALTDVRFEMGACYPNDGTVETAVSGGDILVTFDDQTRDAGDVEVTKTVQVGPKTETSTTTEQLASYGDCPTA